MSRHVLNTVATALLAMALAIRIGLPMPQTTMASVFIVMQSQTGLVLEKSFYRLLGTLFGALATFALAALFAQTPARFLIAIGAWVTVCTIGATFSRQFRAYGIVLTGYTAVLIGIPAVFRPSHIATDALMRVGEVSLGILCATVIALLNGSRPREVQGSGAATSPAQARHAGTPQPHPLAASLAGLYPAIAMLATGTVWMMTSWPGGENATLNATVDCALVALAPRPFAAAVQMAGGTLLAVAIALAMWFTYPLLGADALQYLALLPALALGATFTARPDWLGFGLGYSITLCMLAYPDGLSSPPAAHLHDAGGIVFSIVVLVATSAALQRLRERAAAANAPVGLNPSSRPSSRYNSGLPVLPASDDEPRQNRSQSPARV